MLNTAVYVCCIFYSSLVYVLRCGRMLMRRRWRPRVRWCCVGRSSVTCWGRVLVCGGGIERTHTKCVHAREHSSRETCFVVHETHTHTHMQRRRSARHGSQSEQMHGRTDISPYCALRFGVDDDDDYSVWKPYSG